MDRLSPQENTVEDCLSGGGEMGALMRAFDWSRTAVGPVSGWPQSLKTALNILLDSGYPMYIAWGSDFTQFYNDAYRPILGATKHPAALGQGTPECFAEIWDFIGPMFRRVISEGKATTLIDQLLELDRNGFVEECYFTFSYSAIRDETGRPGGVLVTVLETTSRVLGERRLRTLRDLSERGMGESRTTTEACRAAATTLTENPHDFPFALLYLLDEDGQRAQLCEAVRLGVGTPASPTQVEVDGSDGWDFRRALETGTSQIVTDLTTRFGQDIELPAGPWTGARTERALVLPLAKAGGQELPTGFLVAGVSPRLALGDDYRSFLELAAGHLATTIANTRAYEEERRRAEALAELDRAKTVFFSNISHEFRTPLTLLLGPLEETLNKANGSLAAREREALEQAHRNALRLLKLVNTLLDFSRIEAGRLQALFEPTDVSAYTIELASVFRSAIERASLHLVVDCPPLPEAVYLDREMWEKVVLNLISNAFKFTFEGEIRVRLRHLGDRVELDVSDTGTGIPESELPNLFKRFHRVRGARGRSYEGSGIGLALVQDLVRLHGGEVRVASEEGRGTTFTVSIPTGKAHLPADRLGAARRDAAAAPRATPYVEEALRWLPVGDAGTRGRGDTAIADTLTHIDISQVQEQSPGSPRPRVPVSPRPLILLADDNADMRDYVRRLLAERYEVEAVGDGEAALRAARERLPDLVLTDVMMPRMDGFELLRALRDDPRGREVPVIMLSARAGEEARVEGLDAGASDYLIKPFSARELLARVGTHLEMARLRREAARREQALLAEARLTTDRLSHILAGINDDFVMYDRDWRYVYVNDRAAETLGYPKESLIGQRIWDLFPESVGNLFYQKMHEAMEERRNVTFEFLYEPFGKWFENRAYPLEDGLLLFATDITERKLSEEALRQSEERFSKAFNASAHMMTISTLDEGRYLDVNDAVLRTTGYARDELVGRTAAELNTYAAPADRDKLVRELREAGAIRDTEVRFRRKDGNPVTVLLSADIITLGGRQCLLTVSQDITERKQTEQALRESEERFRTLFESIDEGFCILEMIFDDAGQAVDYRFLEVNPVFERQTGLSQAQGKTARHLVPDLEEHWIKIYGNVALTGEPVRFINGSEAMGRWFDVYACRVGGQDSRKVALLFNDITEHKRAEVLLDAQKQSLEMVVTGAPLADVLTYLTGIVEQLSAGQAIASILLLDEHGCLRNGASPSLPEDYLRAIDGLKADPEVGTCCAAAATGAVVVTADIESDPKWQNLKHLPLKLGYQSAWSKPITTRDGRVLGTFGTYFRERREPSALERQVVEILSRTAALAIERRRAEQALRESEERFRNMADNSPVMVWVADAVGRCTYLNRVWYDYTEQTPETGLGMGWLDVIHPDDREQSAATFLAAINRREAFRLEYRLRRHDGAYGWFIDAAAPRFGADGEFLGFVGSVFDITERQHMEEALRASQKLNKDVLDSMSAHISVLDTDGTITLVNESWRRFAIENGADWTMKGVGVGTNYLEVCRIAQGADADDAEAIYRGLREILDGARTSFSLEYPCHSPTAERWFLLTATPFTNAGGGAVVAHQNITERRKAELALREADQRKDEFLAMLAHELRNPLAPIRNAAQVVRRLSPPDPQLQWARELIDRQTQHLSRLVDDLLDVSRITQGKITLRKEAVELMTVVARAVETSRPLIDARRHQLHISLPKEPVRLEGDVTRLEQIISNLLNNAAKYTEEGGEIWLSAEESGNEVVLRVKDSGIGILPDDLPHVFDLFSQANRSLDRAQGGLGIGLTLVRRLVEMHGGRVEAASEGLGSGSVFTVRLPALPQSGQAVKASEADAANDNVNEIAQASRCRVLVVDDNPDSAESMALLLKLDGHQVQTAFDGEEALQAARALRPQVVILDIGLPGMDGFEVATRMRKELRMFDATLIALTGYGRDEDREHSSRSGFDHHFVKPVDPTALQSLINSLAAAS